MRDNPLNWGLLLAAVCLGCAHPGTRVENDSAVNFSRYQHIGVAPFTDSRGQGRLITEGIDSGLRRILHGGADLKMVEDILREHKPDRDFGVTIEALEFLRVKASADAVIIGSMTPNWSAASITAASLSSRAISFGLTNQWRVPSLMCAIPACSKCESASPHARLSSSLISG